MAVWPRKTSLIRPSLVIFSETNVLNSYEPANDFICTDHGRSPIDVSSERIESAGRMVDGTYRSHYITSKSEFGMSWEAVPSRSGGTNVAGTKLYTHTADGMQGGLAIVNFLEGRNTPFYLKLSTDDGAGYFPDNDQPLNVYRVFVKDLSYSVNARSQYFDFMNISVKLVEV